MRRWLLSMAILGLGSSLALAAAPVSELAGAMDSDNPTTAKQAEQKLFELVQAGAGGDDHDAIAAALAGELDRHSVDTRRQLCEMLSYIGDTRQRSRRWAKP
jgi:hypothetical protein